MYSFTGKNRRYDMASDLNPPVRELLEKLQKSEIIDFLVEYSENGSKLANAVNVSFRKPEFDTELSKIEHEIDTALEDVSDYRNRDSWGNVHFDVSGIIEEIYQRMKQGHIKLAFAETELLYRKLLESFEYQGECEISDMAEYCVDIMSDIACRANTSNDKEYIFRKCIELSMLETGKDYGADYEDKLLGISSKFVTKENRVELEDAIAHFGSSWRAESFKLIQQNISESLHLSMN
jgi:hypothetical protein